VAAGTPYQIASISAGAANPALTVATPTSPGDAIFVYCNTGGAATAVSDTKGNTYLQSFEDASNGISFYYSTYKGSPGTPTAALTTSDTITVTVAGPGNQVLAAACSGLAPQAANATNPTGLAGAIHGTSAASSMTITPVNVGDLIVFGQGFAAAATSTTYTGGFAKIGDVLLTGGGVSMGYLVATSTSLTTCSCTLGVSVGWYDGAASFAAAAVTVPPSAVIRAGPPALRHPATQFPPRGPLQVRYDASGPPLGSGVAPWIFMGGQVGGSATTRVFTTGANATNPGDTLLLILTINVATITISSVVDSVGNTYIQDGAVATTSPLLFAFRCPGATGGPGGGQTAAVPAGTSVTVTCTAASGTMSVSGFAVPGNAWGAVDTMMPSTGYNGNAASITQSITPTNDNELVVFAQSNQPTGLPITITPSPPLYSQMSTQQQLMT